MIIKQKPVYYCKHCKKYRLAKNAMEKHEKGCTLNPRRDCGMCEYGDGGMAFEDLLAKFPIVLTPEWVIEGNTFGHDQWERERIKVFEQVKDETICPACRLAWIRQNNVSVEYDYATDSAQFWTAYNTKVNSHI